MKKLTIIIILLFCTLSVSADKLKAGSPVCVTEETYSQATKLSIAGDDRGVDYLFDNSLCFIFESPFDVSVLENKFWAGVSKIRIYIGKESYIVWTGLTSIDRDKR